MAQLINLQNTRAFRINGECLVKVKGNGALGDGIGGAKLWELGLSVEQITVIPAFKSKNILVDDFGPDIPAELMWMLAEVAIRMDLVQYDNNAVMACLQESMAGGESTEINEGVLAGAGRTMGAGLPVFSPGNHYISLNLLSPVLGKPWRFPTSVLSQEPITIPLGTERSVCVLNWRAIPYAPLFSTISSLGLGNVSGSFTLSGQQYRAIEPKSQGKTLWDRTSDTE